MNKPQIIAPPKPKPKPKRTVKKEVVAWANVYKRETFFSATREIADGCADADRIACVKLTGEYEVEE